jgi:4-alpha-glucanotransferase
MGWWRSTGGDSTRTPQDVELEKARAKAYLAPGAADMNFVMIRTLMASVADTVLFPMQDVLGLGSDARMNIPSVTRGNWRWRMKPGALSTALGEKLKEMTELYDR